MGRRDYRHREPKKARKNARKLPQVNITTTPASVEVIRKTSKRKEEEEER